MKAARLLRDRLVTSIDDRWGGGLFVVSGGPGMGKSTLLQQAIIESSTLGRGTEWLVRCRPGWGANLLHEALFGAAQPEIAGEADSRSIEDLISIAVEFLWAKAPDRVGFIIDDSHELDHSGLGYIASLAEQLPANAHLLASTRPHAGVMASLMMADPAMVINDEALLFDNDEISDFAARIGVGADDLRSAGGWPAVLALTASAGADVAGAYLYESVLAGLSRRQQGDLAIAASLGELDAAAARSVLECRTSELAGVPLVDVAVDGAISVHDLWQEPMAGIIDRERLSAAARTVALGAASTGEIDRAVSTLMTNGLGSDARALMVEHIADGPDRVPVVRIDRWLALLTSPEHALLRETLVLLRGGLVAGSLEPDQLDRLSQRCRGAGETDLEALVAEVRFAVAWSADDVPLCLEIADRMIELFDGGAAMLAHAPYSRAFTEARWLGDHEKVIDLIRDGRRSLGDRMGPVWGVSLELETLARLGRPLEGLALLESIDQAQIASMPRSVTFGLTYWFSGRPDDAIDALESLLVPTGQFHGIEQSWLTTAELFRAWRGAAGGSFDQVEVPEVELSAYSRIGNGLVGIARSINEGEEEVAAAAVDTLATEWPPSDGLSLQAWFMGAAGWYVLRPQDRPLLDSFMTTDLLGGASALFRAFVAGREAGVITAADMASCPEPAQIAVLLPARWAAELALRLSPDLAPLRERVLGHLIDDGVEMLESLAEGSDEVVAKAAIDALAATPRRPRNDVVVNILGASSIETGNGVPSSEWRRGRVRALFGLLAQRGSISRARAVDLLWPELDESAGRRNLRVTMSYLTKALEPDRPKHVPAWFVRAEGDRIRLITDGLDADVVTVVQSLEAASSLQRQGLATKAIAELTRACEAYGGPFLADLDDSWIEQERAEFAHRMVSACLRLSSLLVVVEDPAARRWAERAIEIDPLNLDAREALVAAVPKGSPDHDRAIAGLRELLDELA